MASVLGQLGVPAGAIASIVGAAPVSAASTQVTIADATAAEVIAALANTAYAGKVTLF